MTKGAFGSSKQVAVRVGGGLFICGVVRPTRQFGSEAKYVKAIKKRIDVAPLEVKVIKETKGFKGFFGRMFQRKGK